MPARLASVIDSNENIRNAGLYNGKTAVIAILYPLPGSNVVNTVAQIDKIADTLEEWFVEGAADGFNILPPYFPGAFADFVDLVVPELQRRGLFRKDFAGTTLRDNLGLPTPRSEPHKHHDHGKEP